MLKTYGNDNTNYVENKLVVFGNVWFCNMPMSSKYKCDNIKLTVEQFCDLGDGVYKVESESKPEKVYTLPSYILTFQL